MILDTNALSAFLLADRDLLKVFPAHAVLRLPVIVLGEYRFGLARSKDRLKLTDSWMNWRPSQKCCPWMP